MKFIKRNGELKDKEIIAALRKAADEYENGDLADVRDTLYDIVCCIDEFGEREPW